METMFNRDRIYRIAPWAQELSATELDRAQAGLKERTYARGTVVCEIGKRFEPWVGVVDGLISVRSLTPEGKEVAFAGVHSGGWFGEGSVLKNEPRRYEAVALRESRVVLLDRPTFMWLFEHSAGFNRFLVGQLNERLGHFMALLENDRKLDSTGRVARALALMMNPVLYPDADRRLMITQEEVGTFAGVSRPTANQALRELERAGILRREYGGLTILDLERLRGYEAQKPLVVVGA
jgi:CRP-like cAMP-binding protein